MNLVVVVFVACAAACLVGHVAILRSVVRKGTSRNDAGVPRPNLVVELVWAVLPIVVLAFVLTATWAAVRGNAAHRHAPEAIMEVAR